MPAEGLPWLERDQVLSFEEIERLVAVLASMGVCDVRLTGGEPLVRRDFPRLAGMLASVDGVEDLSVTTNGFLLERDAEALVAAGINRFNVSVDSLQRDRFFEMTRRDALPRVLRGLQALAHVPRRASDQDQRRRDARLHRDRDPAVRAVRAERTPTRCASSSSCRLDADRQWDPGLVLTGEEIRAAIDEVYPLEAQPREPSATARVYRFADGHGKIGFINPLSEPFCGDCDRIRVTAEGKLRTCLFSLHETDLRTPIRDAVADDGLREIIRDAVWRKELKHGVNEPGFRQPERSMTQIGG